MIVYSTRNNNQVIKHVACLPGGQYNIIIIHIYIEHYSHCALIVALYYYSVCFGTLHKH